MLIILEGPDRAGKSTLARAVGAYLNLDRPNDVVRTIHKGPPTEHPLREYEDPLLWYRPGQRTHVICDRWHIGERVYPQVLRRPSQMSTAIYDHIELFLRSRGALLVHVTVPNQVLASRLADEQRERPERSLVTAQQLVRSAQLIESEYEKSQLMRTRIDTRFPLSRGYVESIILKAEQAEREAERLNPFRTYVGPPDPKLLLVGDVRHDYRTMHEDREVETAALADRSPAFGPYPGTSGDYLLQAVGFRLNLGLINANDVDDAELAWLALGLPPVVALGRRAWAKVSRWRDPEEPNTGLRLGAAPHPQYWRRFFNRHMDDYAGVITRAAEDGEDHLAARPRSSWLDRV